jgi:hypothetical protein
MNQKDLGAGTLMKVHGGYCRGGFAPDVYNVCPEVLRMVDTTHETVDRGRIQVEIEKWQLM